MAFFDKYKFQVSKITQGDHYRMFTSAFLHVDYNHLFLNLFTLFLFSNQVLIKTGSLGYIFIYIISLLSGSYFALLYHKNEPFYSAVGASGAVTGIVYSSILLYPEMKLVMLFFPIPLPGYVFGIAYLLYSIYGMKKNIGNIGHTAHFGGAIAGLLSTIFINPSVLFNDLWIIIILISPLLYFFYSSDKKN